MKNLFKVFGIIAVVAVIGFSMIACVEDGDDDKESSGKTFNSIEDFNKWLEKQPTNTPSNPYRVKLNTNDGSFRGHLLRYFGNFGKYVHLDISDSKITGIGEEAFDGCDTLVGITIGNSVTSIGRKAFSGSGLISVTIPNNVTSIENETFYSCSKLTSITIGNKVSIIGDYAFYECTSLTSVTVPNSVTNIGQQAFWQCTSLTSVNIPSSVTTIKRNTFQYCTSLTSVIIPSNVSIIEKEAFSGCTSLTSVKFEGTIDSSKFITNAFDGDLHDKFYETDLTNGTPGTYTRAANSDTWSKQ